MLFTLLFFPSLSLAIDSGGAIFQHRWHHLYEESSENGQFVDKTFTYEAQAVIEAWQNLYGYGQLRVLAEWVDPDGVNRVDRAYIELADYPLYGDIMLTARLGDKEIPYSPLIEPYIRYRGGALTLNTQKWAWSIFGGQAREISGGGGDITNPYARQMVIGMRGKYILEPLTLGFGVLGVEGSQRQDSPRLKSGTTITLDAEWRIKPWLRWYVEGDLVYYDLAEDRLGYRRDYALLFGPVIKSEPVNLEILYKRIGPFATSVSENFNSDKEGIFAVWDLRPYKFLSLFGAFQGYREDLNHLPNILATQNVQGRGGLRLIGGAPWPSLSTSIDYTQRRSMEKTARPIFTEQYNYNFEISQYLHGFRYSLRFQRIDFKDLFNPLSNFRNDSFFADLRKMWGRYFDTYFSAQWQRQFDFFDFINQRQYYGRLGALYRIFSIADLRVEAAYTRTYRYSKTAPVTIEDKGEAVGGLVFYLPWQMNFNLDYTYRHILQHQGKGPDLQVSSRSESQANFRLTKRFSWGEPMVARGVAVPGLAPPGVAVPWGTLYGYVYVDLNGNRAMEPGEPGLGGMKITLEDGTAVVTDSKGYFEIPRVVIGEHTVSFDLRRLPANYDPISSPKQKVEIKKREKSEVDFAVGALGSILGRVIEDENENGKADEDEKGLQGIGLILEREGDKRTAYSDTVGDFLFDNILGGTYKLYVDKETLPERAKLTSPEVLEINLPPGGEVKDLRFLIHIVPRPVIKTFIGNGAPQPAPTPPPAPPPPRKR